MDYQITKDDNGERESKYRGFHILLLEVLKAENTIEG
jgi:hypothetical protein